MALYGHIRLLSVLLGTFLSFCLLLYECKKLDGYRFPVYSTELCPRNQTEWNERSSAINCTEDNGYLCFPNEKFTQLLEFCHRARFIWIQEGYCLYLRKDDSTIYSYSCSSFQSGCHNSSFPSYDLFEHSGCTSIGNGCFLAEPSCKGSDTTTSLPETTKPTHVENVTRNYSTTVSTDEKTNQTLTNKDYVIYDEIFMMPILAGVLIPIIIFCMLCIIYRTGYHICETKSDVESPGEGERKQLLPDPNKMLLGTNKEGYHICETESDVESPGEGERKQLLPDPNKMPLGTNKEESNIDRAIFRQWKEENENFVITRACKQVEKIIKKQNMVVVTGNSGSGKSAIIQHIALNYRSDGWTVKPIYSVKEIIDAWSKLQDALDRTLLVFNDPLGNESFDEEKYKSWKYHEERLKSCLKDIKMLLSCRRYILNNVLVRGILKDKSCTCIIDLGDNQHKLDNEEKRTILEIYSSNSGFLKEDINEIIKSEGYFPLLCKLYSSNKNKRKGVLQFFKEPVEVCEDQMNYFKSKCKENYCALVLLVLCNNQLCVEDMQNDNRLREKFELALKLCEMKSNTAPHSIDAALKTLEGFFVKKIDDTYHFYHDFVMEVTTCVFGTDYPLETIQYADIGFLRRRVNLKCSNDNREEMKLENCDHKIDEFTIFLKDTFVEDLVDRLFNEIFGERMLDVVLNPCMRNEKVATCFIKKLKDNPDKLNELLAKKQIHKEFVDQEDNQAFKQSFGSKLDFLFLEDKVPILSAIIVFCHTNISKHCLETLQRMQNSLKDTSLFSAVCCNGSLDLFNVFPKEQIKLFLVKQWAILYPIHIVSLFHNHDILRELIQVKNEVNLRTRRGYGYTPLMLAVLNTDTSEQKNKETRNQSIDITVELLLTHGANINFCDPGNPLHIASSIGNNHTVELLLSKGADINLCDLNKETPLHEASGKGHERTVQLLLDKGADINSCDTNKNTPLHKASEKGHDSTVQLLLDKGADINSCDTNKETPLHKASKWGHERTVQRLLDKGADINSCDKYNETPLHKASERGHESTVQLLLNKGADINSCEKYNETPLHKASKGGHESTVQLLLNKGADINSCDKYNETPLHKASEWGHQITVQLLLEKGANINSFDTGKRTPLHKAIECGRESIIQLLLDNGAEITMCDTNKETLLLNASKFGLESTVQLLLDKGADINSCDTNKETPLQKASEGGHERTAQLLLEKGADVNSCDLNKKTPLHKASEGGHESTVQLLLEKGANINSCDTNKETSLQKASEGGHERTVQILLEKGADVNSCDLNKKTPLHKASEGGHERTVQLLLEKGADVNSCDLNKKTPLHKASEGGHESTVQLLLEKGADINSCDTNKETPLHKASKWGLDSTVQLLLDKGADINSCDLNNETPLHKASRRGRESTIHILLDNGADINSCDTNKETPLHKASEGGLESTVQLLLTSEWGRESTVQLLLDNGANINSCDTNKQTPLHKASE
nr:uncharacterized protein LOC105328615 [Crassostrea gigas]